MVSVIVESMQNRASIADFATGQIARITIPTAAALPHLTGVNSARRAPAAPPTAPAPHPGHTPESLVNKGE